MKTMAAEKEQGTGTGTGNALSPVPRSPFPPSPVSPPFPVPRYGAPGGLSTTMYVVSVPSNCG